MRVTKAKRFKLIVFVPLGVLVTWLVKYVTDQTGSTEEDTATFGINHHPLHPVLLNSQDNTRVINNSRINAHLHPNLVIGTAGLTGEEYCQLRKVKVNPIDQPILIENRQLCNQTDEVPYLLVVIPTKPSDSKMRNVIRKTIGSYVSGDFSKQLLEKHHVTMRLLFVVGNGPTQSVNDFIERENDIHRDMLQANFTDTYRTLTEKMLIALKWSAAYCATVDYIIKVDTDSFINIPVLIPILKSTTTKPNGTIIGHLIPHGRVQRNGIWKVTEQEFPFNHYPPYVCGQGYVISGNILSRLVHAAEYCPSFPVEDAYITGLMARVTGPKLVEHPGFGRWVDKPPVPCLFFKQRKVTGTKVTAKLWEQLWDIQFSYHDTCVENTR